MHEWLSGGASPCQGEGRGFESRLVLFFFAKNNENCKEIDRECNDVLAHEKHSRSISYRTQGELTVRSREGPLEGTSASDMERSGMEVDTAHGPRRRDL